MSTPFAIEDRPVPRRIHVLHRGALGDSVLLWPRARYWVAAGARVELITDKAKADLAQQELGIVGVDAEQARYNNLWREGAAIEPVPGAGLVVDHVSSEGSSTFRENLAAMFPGARIIHEPAPRGGRDGAAWTQARPAAQAARRLNPDGPVVLHVGAGSVGKRWPAHRWQELAEALSSRAPVRVIAGEVEREQFDAESGRRFEAMGGRFLDDLPALADALRAARLVVACDSGPAHLSAQLGIATLTLFGPSDPALWAPVGPSVRALAPTTPRGMAWLGVEAVLAAALQLAGLRPMK